MLSVHRRLLTGASAFEAEAEAPALPVTLERRQGSENRHRRKQRGAEFIDTGLVVAAIGRANVGKSTLFNRLGRSGIYAPASGSGDLRTPFVPSVVESFPGVTRDARSTQAAISDLSFTLIDTAGLEDAPKSNHGASVFPAEAMSTVPQSMLNAGALDTNPHYRNLYRSMSDSTVKAVRDSHAALFVIDASVGVTAIDEGIARWLHFMRGDVSDRIVLVANKADTQGAQDGALDALSLGFGEPVVISAEHNMGMADLYQAILALHEARQEEQARSPPLLRSRSEIALQTGAMHRDVNKAPCGKEDTVDFDDGELLFDPDFVRDEPINKLVVSIVGRPNVGKSSLVSRLLDSGPGETLVGPAAGVTRDAVLKEWRPKGRNRIEPLWLVDTAGIRPRNRAVETRIETLSVQSSLRALRVAHVAVLVIDANEKLTAQDVKIAHVVVAEGRAIVLVVNKMDCIQGEGQKVAELREQLAYQIRTSLHHVAGVEVVEMSARSWASDPTQAARLYGAIQRVRERWEKRIPTSALTRYVTRFNESTALGMRGAKRGRRGTTKFISQKKTRPPMFRLDGSSAVSDNYIQALTNGIREEFGFQGVPIRIKRPSRRQRR